MVDNFLFLGVTQSSEVLAWDLETLTGALMQDLSGNARTGTITGTTVVKNGAWANARSFNGTSDEISGGDVADMLATDFGVSIWVRTSASALSYLVSKRDVAIATNAGWAVRMDAGGTVTAEHSDGGSVITATSAALVNDNALHHVAVNWDRSANMQVYIDGLADGSASISAQSGSIDNAIDLFLARSGGATPNRLNGTLDELYIFSRLLTTAEIDAIARAPRTRLTSPDGATKIPLLDSRASMDITRTVTMPSITGNQVIDIDLRIAKRTFGVTGQTTPYGEFSAPEILGEIEKLIMTYASQANNPRIPSANTQGARMDFEWGHRNANEDWKRYFVRGAKMTPVKDNVVGGGADRIFNYQLAFSEGGKLSARGDPDELAG